MRWGRKLRVHLHRRWWVQALLLGVIWAGGEAVARGLEVPLPGSILGLGALWLALETGLLRARWFRRGASGLLAHLILFFVPAMLAVVNHRELLGATGLKLLLAVLVGTPMVMIGTALVVEIGFRLGGAREGRET